MWHVILGSVCRCRKEIKDLKDIMDDWLLHCQVGPDYIFFLILTAFIICSCCMYVYMSALHTSELSMHDRMYMCMYSI